MDFTKARTWAEVSLSALEHNYNAIRARLKPETRLCCVVKANAYGHGAERVAPHLQSLGADAFAVATLPEAISLRECGIARPILIFGITPPEPEFTSELLRYDLTQTIEDYDTAQALSRQASQLRGVLKCHIKINTGMNRLGMTNKSDIRALLNSPPPNISVDGVFTHFAVSDTPGGEKYTQMQLALFNDLTQNAQNPQLIRHSANSGAILGYPETHMDMARAGIALYGYPTSADLLPVMELKSRVIAVHALLPGESVSYGGRYTAASERKIAVLPIGYADGLFRSLSGKLEVQIGGKLVPQIGTICMDMCMIDATELPSVQTGDIAMIFGREAKTAFDVAEICGTIPYEILCAVSARVPRVYVP
jgi:alanine racemase